MLHLLTWSVFQFSTSCSLLLAVKQSVGRYFKLIKILPLYIASMDDSFLNQSSAWWVFFQPQSFLAYQWHAPLLSLLDSQVSEILYIPTLDLGAEAIKPFTESGLPAHLPSWKTRRYPKTDAWRKGEDSCNKRKEAKTAAQRT